MDDLVIGIDLGTTNSCISLCTKKQIKVLENPLGDRTTPSFIYFEPDGGIVIGKHASKISISRPENGIYEMKRLVGRKYDDRHLQKSMKYLSYTVTPSASNFPVISFKQKNYIVKKTPQDLYTVFLKELKKYAEIKLKQPINKAVITVPAYFNVQQREVTLAAAKEAGFHVLKLLNEPTAAALAYYYKQNDIDNIQRSLVYDLGGGTFDIAVLEKQGKNIKVICVGGHAQLGGHDLDNCLLEHVCQQLKRKYRYDAENPDDKSMLRTKCEQAKKELSTAEETVIVINGLVPEHRRIKIVITRDQFEDLADDLFEKTVFILDCCLRNSNISKESIKEVILSGGCTRIPRIQELLSEFFDGKKLSKFVNPDECVAEGAALQAAMLSTSHKQGISKMEMVDVIPFSLGFKSLGHKMCFILKKNKKIPACVMKDFHTKENNQRTMPFRIYEGESLDATKNRFLGTFIVSEITPAPSGKVKIIVTFSIDNNCMITATAEEKFGKYMKQLIINYTASDLQIKTRENLDSLAGSVEDDENDKTFQNFVQSKCYLIEYSGAVMYNLEKKKLKKKHKEVFEICKMYKEMAEDLKKDSENQLKTWISKCKEQCQPLAEKHKFKYMPAIMF